MQPFLKKNEIPALVKVKGTDQKLSQAIEGLCHDHGMGTLVPNTFVMGETENPEKFVSFSETVHSLYASRKNLLVVRQNQAVSQEGNLNKLHAKREKVIDLWWGRESKNSNLLLTSLLS